MSTNFDRRDKQQVHGFERLALAANATLASRCLSRRRVRFFSKGRREAANFLLTPLPLRTS